MKCPLNIIKPNGYVYHGITKLIIGINVRIYLYPQKKNIVIPLIHSDHVIAIDSDMITISSILQPRENIYINPM